MIYNTISKISSKIYAIHIQKKAETITRYVMIKVLFLDLRVGGPDEGAHLLAAARLAVGKHQTRAVPVAVGRHADLKKAAHGAAATALHGVVHEGTPNDFIRHIIA